MRDAVSQPSLDIEESYFSKNTLFFFKNDFLFYSQKLATSPPFLLAPAPRLPILDILRYESELPSDVWRERKKYQMTNFVRPNNVFYMKCSKISPWPC